MPLLEASKLTNIPPEKLLLMSEGMQDLMIWLQRKALEEEDRSHFLESHFQEILFGLANLPPRGALFWVKVEFF